MTYTIISAKVYDKDKDGNQYRSKKNGDAYKIATVMFAEDPRSVRLFLWGNATCEIGYQYEGIIKEEMYNEKMTYTFAGERKVDKNAAEIEQLKFSLANTNRKLDEIVTYLKEKPWLKVPPVETTSKGDVMPNFDIK